MMRLTPSKIRFDIREVFPEIDKAKRINKGNTSLIYEYKNKFYVFTIETVKPEWLYHIGLISNYKYVGDAYYAGYSSGDGEYKEFLMPVTFYVIRKLKKINKDNRHIVDKYVVEIDNVFHKFLYENKDRFVTFWGFCLNNAKSKYVKKLANFISDYDSPMREYYWDASDYKQWAYDSKGVYCIDPFHDSELSEILWLSKGTKND